MTEELYKRHRPKTLERVVGNEQTVVALRNMLERKTLPHTILFHGPSGCGKTTLARILKDSLGCKDLDFSEVNASSFRGIDSVRDISRVMHLSPTGPCRVWLMDEVHKWTNDAQNAALKMLEDTPKHVYFFLCTTEPSKLIKAIQTRCCEMPVRLLTYDEMEKLVVRVAKRENIELSKETMDELLTSAQGSARTLLVLLEKIAHIPEDQRKAAIEARLAEENEAIELCRALVKKAPWGKVAALLKNLKGDPESVRWAVLGYCRAVLLSNPKPDAQAFFIIQSFSSPFYDSKEAGLAAACYEALFAN